MDFMGISIGVLALVCALVLLFGVRGARKVLGWSFGLLIFCAIGTGAVIWIWSSYGKSIQTAFSSSVTPVDIFPPLPDGFVLVDTPDLTDKIKVTGPDKRTFVFSAGTSKSAIETYMLSEYGTGPLK